MYGFVTNPTLKTFMKLGVGERDTGTTTLEGNNTMRNISVGLLERTIGRTQTGGVQGASEHAQ